MMRHQVKWRASALVALGLLLAGHLVIASDQQQNSDVAADTPAAQVALADDTPASGSDPSKPVLLFIRLRPSKNRSKVEVVTLTSKWSSKSWGGTTNTDLSVIDNDAAVLTCKDMNEALKAKDWLLTQQVVYEVELNQGGAVYRRPGDVPLEELRRGLSRNAQQERRKQGWAWLRRAAKQQGVKLKQRRRRRGATQGRLPGDRGEL